jgi:hypothetical protein
MSTGFDQELKAAFQAASEFVQPHPRLADRARAGGRRRRRWALAAAAAASAVILAIAVTTYAAVAHHQDHAALAKRSGGSPRVLLLAGAPVTQLAVSGRYLYALQAQNSLLTAYDLSTGKLIGPVRVPSEPSALAVGPGGLVWVAFSPDQGAGPAGIWLLTADLRLHSAAPGIRATTILPAGQTSALVPDQDGLLLVHLPVPGQSGRASQQLEPGSSLGPSQSTRPGPWSARLGGRGRVAVLVTGRNGSDGHLVVAGSPSLRFGGTWRTQISAMTGTGNSLWVTTYALRNGESSLQGPLVRLNTRLAPTTPASVRSSPVLSRSESVWSAGGTIWVGTGVRDHSLVCFTAGDKVGPVTTMPVTGEVVALAAAGDTVYVNAEQPPGSDAPSAVISYPIPAACRT